MIQLPLACFIPKTDWTPTPVSRLPSWAGAKRVAIDTETHDPRLKALGPGVRRDGRMVGVSFAIEDGPAHYLPFGHRLGDNLDREQVLGYLRDQAAGFTGTIAGANLQYDLDYLCEAGISFAQAQDFRDVQVAEPLLDENQFSYSLESIAQRHGLLGKDEATLQAAAAAYGVDAKTGLWQLPARFVGQYAEQDARLALTLLRRQERILEEEDLWKVYMLECRLLPVLLKMRRRGVRVSHDRLEKVNDWAVAEERAALGEIGKQTGVVLGLESTTKPKDLEKVFKAIGVELPRTTKGLPSIRAEVLAGIKHPVAALVRRARRMNKLRTTFVASIVAHTIKGRIHTTFNQLKRSDDGGDDDVGTIARLSSTDPNLQQQPARDPEIGPLWRSIYLPDTDNWTCLDFSQQEPRWLVHYAEIKGCSRAREFADEYRARPETDNHDMVARMTGIERKPAKEIFLGLCYGMGEAKLCHKLGLPTVWVLDEKRSVMKEVAGPEGRAILDKFNARLPFVRQMSWKAKEKAEERGYIMTVLGRRARFPLVDGKRDWLSKALNRLIQGTSADQTKKAMVDADAAGIPLQLQVHDELDFSAESLDQAKILAQIMRDAIPCKVPHLVKIEMGPSWGERKEVA